MNLSAIRSPLQHTRVPVSITGPGYGLQRSLRAPKGSRSPAVMSLLLWPDFQRLSCSQLAFGGGHAHQEPCSAVQG